MSHKVALKLIRKELKKVGKEVNLTTRLRLLSVENEKNASTPQLKEWHAATTAKFQEMEDKLRARSLDLAGSINALEDARYNEKEGK